MIASAQHLHHQIITPTSSTLVALLVLIFWPLELKLACTTPKYMTTAIWLLLSGCVSKSGSTHHLIKTTPCVPMIELACFFHACTWVTLPVSFVLVCFYSPCCKKEWKRPSECHVLLFFRNIKLGNKKSWDSSSWDILDSWSRWKNVILHWHGSLTIRVIWRSYGDTFDILSYWFST